MSNFPVMWPLNVRPGNVNRLRDRTIQASDSESDALESQAGYLVRVIEPLKSMTLEQARTVARGMAGCGKVGIYRLHSVVEADR